jgi:hypothetical protein
VRIYQCAPVTSLSIPFPSISFSFPYLTTRAFAIKENLLGREVEKKARRGGGGVFRARERETIKLS